MKERPILFSAPMVRALLDGSKTQTRRVVKPQPPEVFDLKNHKTESGFVYAADYAKMTSDVEKQQRVRWDCPYGQPGDRLWVRETFGHFERNDTLKSGDTIYYRADGECLELQPWRPSIHMPRWASRILLEVTAVRVERLQDIRDSDALAEGIAPLDHPGAIFCPAKSAYSDLWDSINGDGSWFQNPWVWVIEFKRVQPPSSLPANCGSGHCSCIECHKEPAP